MDSELGLRRRPRNRRTGRTSAEPRLTHQGPPPTWPTSTPGNRPPTGPLPGLPFYGETGRTPWRRAGLRGHEPTSSVSPGGTGPFPRRVPAPELGDARRPRAETPSTPRTAAHPRSDRDVGQRRPVQEGPASPRSPHRLEPDPRPTFLPVAVRTTHPADGLLTSHPPEEPDSSPEETEATTGASGRHPTHVGGPWTVVPRRRRRGPTVRAGGPVTEVVVEGYNVESLKVGQGAV